MTPRRSVGLLVALATAILIGLSGPTSVAAAGFTPAGALPELGTGHIWSVAVSPQDPNLIVAGTDNGIYQSGDGGTSWHQVALPAVRVWTVVFDIRHATNVYAGTSDHGIARSTDSGATWTGASAGLPSLNVRCMTSSLSQLVAGTDSGIALSQDGTHWVAGGLATTSISAVTVVANSPSLTLMAGTDTGDTSKGYLWTNSGSTWQVDHGTGLPGQAVVLALASGPVSQAISHRPIVANLGGTATAQGTYRSLDSGQTFTPANNLPAVGTATLTLTTSTFSPLDPNVVYSGADAGGSTGGAIMRSVDSGVTYTDISQGLAAKNVVSIGVTTTTPPTVFVAVDPPSGGASVWKFTDTGAPPPPALIAESPGAIIPEAVATPTPSPTPADHGAAAKPSSGSGGGLWGALGTIFHWPVPLVYELIAALLVVYGYLRWRQRAYIEGPP